jgi:DNA-binding CsgD family transcriptional regulator
VITGEREQRTGPLLAERALRGRRSELAVLEALTASAREGAGRIAVLEGPAGIGKSRLLLEARQRAASEGVTVAFGRADELDQVTPWGVLIRALSSSGPPLLDASGLGTLRGLSDQRLAVVERMREAVEHASGSRPVLVALDDLQWADPSTLFALGVLVAQLFSYPIGWLLARRPLPTRSALDGLLERLDELGATRVHLGPLEPADALAFARDLSAPGDAEDLSSLIADADGNPFFIIELLRAHSLQDQAEGGRATVDVAQSVRSAVSRHLRSLSEGCRQLLRVASVLGREFSVAEVAAMTGTPASRLLPGVDEALAAEVLVELSGRLAFRHDLLRQAVYDGVPESVRVALHRDAAEALRRTGAPVIRVAGQLAFSAEPGDEAAISAMQQAVAELTPASPKAAADLALRAVEIVGEDDERRLELGLAAVHALGVAGQLGDALALGQRYIAEQVLPAPLEAALQLELRNAWLFVSLEPYPTPVPDRLLRDPKLDQGVIATALALDQIKTLQGLDTARALENAMQAITEGGRASELAMVAQLQLINSIVSGQVEQGLVRAETTLAVARTLEGPHSSGTFESLLAVALTANGRLEDALAMVRTPRATLGAADRAGLTYRDRWLHAMILLVQGKLDDAHAEASGAVTMAVELGYLGRIAIPLSVLVEVELRRGEAREARSTLARYGPLAQGPLAIDTQYAAALVADARGDTAAVRHALDALRADLESGSLAWAQSHHRVPVAVQVALRAGERETARVFARAAVTLAEQNPNVESLVAAGADARGLLDGDAALLRQAVERAARTELRLVEAAAREDLGRMLTAKTASTEGIGQLEAAYDFYLHAGAHRDTARVRAALRRVGVRKRQTTAARPQHGWESLTKSERVVVDLVARGSTNREAAAALFLSPDTINTHLRHAFNKLGVRSRVELARLAAELDREPA